MTEWLLLLIALSGAHSIDQVRISRHSTMAICEAQGVNEIKKFKGHRADFACFEVAKVKR